MITFSIIGILFFVNFVMAAVCSLAAKPHNHVVLENTFPKEQLDHPETLALRKTYKKRQFQLAAGLSGLDCLLFIPMKDSLFMLLFFILLLITLVASFSLQIRYIRKAHELIIKHDWQLTPQPIRVDTKTVLTKNRRILSKNWFWLSFALFGIMNLFLFLIVQGTLSWVMLITSLITWLLFLAGWYAVAHLPVRSITDDDSINQHYNDLTKFYWSLLMVSSSFTFPVIIFIPLISLYVAPTLFMPITIVELLLLIAYIVGTFVLLLTLRKKQDQLLNQAPSYRYYGDDEYWRYGIYNNPNDPRLMIPDRIGMNLSINLGKPVGKILVALIGIIMLFAMLISIVPLYILDYHPDPLTDRVTDQAVVLDGPMTQKSTIPLADITKVNLIAQMPQQTVKENGLATQHYALGKFRVADRSALLYVSYTSQPVLKITTKKVTYYYTNKQPRKTKAAYQKILTERSE